MKLTHRRGLIFAAGLAVTALTVVMPDLFAAENASAADTEADLSKIGYKINPVPLRRRPPELRQLIGLGSYIVNTGGCNDCHTNPSYVEGGDPFLGEPEQINVDGFLAGGQVFGPFTSRNLTPDENGLPAGLTFAGFKKTLRTGFDSKAAHPQFGPLLRVMPWPVFGKKSDHELYAVYQYLKSIPSIPSH